MCSRLFGQTKESPGDCGRFFRLTLWLEDVARTALSSKFAVKQRGARALAMLLSSFEPSKVTMIIAVSSNGQRFAFTSEAFDAL
jgi:hypothetical protein